MRRLAPSAFRLSSCEKVLGLEGVKDAEGNTVQEPPLPIWANFRQRALDPAIAEIDAKNGPRACNRVDRPVKTSAGNGLEFLDQGKGIKDEKAKTGLSMKPSP